MKLALCNAEIASLVDFLGGFEDAEQLSERKYVLEGYLFPDTYEVYTTSSPSEKTA